MKKVIRRVLLISIFLCLCTFLFLASYIGVVYATASVQFDKTKITDSTLCANIYDSENRPLKHTFLKGDFIKLDNLPSYTPKCFISIEDKDFFKHNGLNYKRMISAMVKNISTFSFKEGASTISQQLIKNTHLSNEKTISRKINEIKLTKELEKNFSKNEILEYYLNIIYFGDNCYGIQNASEHYFSHSASKLTLDESAMLAGMIKSPNKYHPVKNYNKSINRRNLVLSELKKDGIILEKEYSIAKNTKTSIILSEIEKMDSYTRSSILEAENLLKMPEKQIAIGGYKIYTYMDKEKQEMLASSLPGDIDTDIAMISMNSKTASVEAYVEKSSLPLINVKRQPASAIKPSLVYAPAINENIISPVSQILDDDISINGYTPKNINNKHYGYISAKEALSKSLNVPAVKILSYVGVNKAKGYLSRQNIDFDEKDNSLALALGGMTYGMTLKDLTNTYQTLANGGKYINARFIKYITDSNNKIIYTNKLIEKTIYREDTAYLTTHMLIEASKTGTAKKLSDLKYQVASKTGTSALQKDNIDAYNISYTSQDVIGVWIGNIDNSPIKHVGGGMPTGIVKNYLSKIYNNNAPKNFEMPSSIVEREIDLSALESEHAVYLACDILPERYREKELFSRFNLPSTKYIDTISLSSPKLSGEVENGIAKLSFNANEYEIYEIFIVHENKKELIATLSSKSGITSHIVPIKPGVITNYTIRAKIINYKTGEEIVSNYSNVVSLYQI